MGAEVGIKEKSRMKKKHGDRLARALEFANESAEYHVRNYADGTLMPGVGGGQEYRGPSEQLHKCGGAHLGGKKTAQCRCDKL